MRSETGCDDRLQAHYDSHTFSITYKFLVVTIASVL